MSIKNLKKAISELEIKEHKDYQSIGEMINELKKKEEEYFKSELYQKYLEKEQQDSEQRRQQAMSLAKKREAQTKEWIENGTLKKGVFIKVSGTRDGEGIREFIDLDYTHWNQNRIICRKWSSLKRVWPWGLKKSPAELAKNGFAQVNGIWVRPESEMTTHDYSKVIGIL